MKSVIALSLLFALFAQGAGATGRLFYDGFESGNTNLWAQDDYRNRCQVVTSAADGGPGPLAGTRMVRCNWDGSVASNTPSAYESLELGNLTYGSEIFFRIRHRRDANTERTDGSPMKFTRIYYWDGNQSTYRDLYHDISSAAGVNNRGTAGTSQIPTYWGDASGDNTASSSAWHVLEYYMNHATGKIRVWHDGIMVRDNTISFGAQKWLPFYLTSNWADPHDSVNYSYFDEIEVFTDTASSAYTGSMLNGDIEVSGGGIAPVLQSVSCSPTSVQSVGTSTCTATISGGTPTTYTWTNETSGTQCTPTGTNPATYTCQYGGAFQPCLTVSNTDGSSGPVCATTSLSVRYRKPSGLGAN